MNIRKLPKEELELLSYSDIAYEILKADKKPKTTARLFKEICDLLDIDEDNMMNMIGDFYTTLTTDKRFLLLDKKAEWDLKEAHIVKPILDEEDEEEWQEEVSEEASEVEDDAISDEEDDYELEDSEEDDLEDLAIISEEEMDE